jgi:hypothetical protein
VNVSYQSASMRLFQESAEELAVRLDQEGTGHKLAAEAREFSKRFTEWASQRPTDEERVATIQRLFDLNHRAMDYLAA